MKSVAQQRIDKRNERQKLKKENYEVNKERILAILPTTKENCITKAEIAFRLTIPEQVVKKILWDIRRSKVPIMWYGNKWSYISYDTNALKEMNEHIERCKDWYNKWMTDIQIIFKDIISKWK